MKPHHHVLVALAAIAIGGVCGLSSARSAAAPAALHLLDGAADATGGQAKVMSLKTLRLYSYGQNAYQDGGGNIAATPRAPQKWVNVAGQVRTIDYEHGRMRVNQRLVQDFVFAAIRNMDGTARVNQVLDGDVAYNVGANGQPQRVGAVALRARRIDMLDNPVSLVRATS